MRVCELMTANPVTVPPDATGEACARIMARAGYRHLPVVDASGLLLGILTDVALFELELVFEPQAPVPRPGPAAGARLAGELAVHAALIATPGEPVIPMLRALADASADAILVCEGDSLVGILTEHDMVRIGAEVLPEHRVTARSRVIDVAPSLPRDAARALMLAERLRHLIVQESGRLVGVLSMRDLARVGVPRPVDALVCPPGVQIRVRELLHQRVLTIPLGAPLSEAAAVMAKNKVGCLPILDDAGEVVGVVTRTDITRAVVVALEEREIFDEEVSVSGGHWVGKVQVQL